MVPSGSPAHGFGRLTMLAVKTGWTRLVCHDKSFQHVFEIRLRFIVRV